MEAGYEHLLPISSSVTSVQTEARCTKASADAARSLAVARLGRDRGCSEKELVLPGNHAPGPGGRRLPRTAHVENSLASRYVRNVETLMHMKTLTYHDHRASMSTLPSNIICTCFVRPYGPEAASVTQLKPRAFGVPCSALGTRDNQ